MGEIPEQLARRELPGFMKVLEGCEVPDPPAAVRELRRRIDATRA